jgi:hypothetical protein
MRAATRRDATLLAPLIIAPLVRAAATIARRAAYDVRSTILPSVPTDAQLTVLRIAKAQNDPLLPRRRTTPRSRRSRT